MTRGALLGSLLALIVSSPRLARAQDPEGAPPEAAPAETEAPPANAPASEAPANTDNQKINLHPEASAPGEPVERGYHVHNGFYLRVNIGLGAYGIRYEDSVSTNGGALAFDVLAGGSPSPGFVIGGALLSDFSSNLDLERDGTKLGDVNVGTVLLGPFVDGFPNPKGGWHLGGMVGIAGIRTDGLPGQSAREDNGGGGAAWFGYDAWVGDEWSVGGLLRLAAAVGRSKDEAGNSRHSTSTSLDLMFTVLYH